MTLPSAAGEVSKASPKTIRLFIQKGPEKNYLLGHHWLRLKIHQKIAIVESARRGALELNALMTLPAEIYIRELDRLFLENPTLRQLEVGPAIHGIAVSLKDWDDGSLNSFS